MKPIRSFDEFNKNGFYITTDLGSAVYDFDSETVAIQGHSTKDGNKRQIEVTLRPEDSAEFNVNMSASEGELVTRDLGFEAELVSVEDVETEKILYQS